MWQIDVMHIIEIKKIKKNITCFCFYCKKIKMQNQNVFIMAFIKMQLKKNEMKVFKHKKT